MFVEKYFTIIIPTTALRRTGSLKSPSLTCAIMKSGGCEYLAQPNHI